MASSKSGAAKKAATPSAPAAKKAVKKTVETVKAEPATKKAAVKKVAQVPAEDQTAKKIVYKKIKASEMPEVDTVVKVTVDGTTSNAIVTGVHDGLRIDAVVQPAGADNYAIGSVPYAGTTDCEPYWNF